MAKLNNLTIPKELQELISHIDCFCTSLQTLGHLAPEQLEALRNIATIESIGASLRLAKSNISNGDVEKILSNFMLLHENIIPSLPKLADQILQLARMHQKITIAEIMRETNAPRGTIKKYLTMLVDRKYLLRHGQGRNVWYTIAS